MSEISASTIAVNRYAPSDCSSIELYNYNGAEEMTLAQLILAVQIRRAATLERDAVVQTNMMNAGVDRINTLSEYLDTVLQALSSSETSALAPDHPDRIASENAKKRWKDEIRDYLLALGAEDANLPEDIGTYDTRMQAVEQIKNQINTANSSVDRIAIEIETAVNHRDTAYKLATECVTHNGSSTMNTAARMK